MNALVVILLKVLFHVGVRLLAIGLCVVFGIVGVSWIIALAAGH